MNFFSLVAKLSNHNQQPDYDVLHAGIKKVVSPLNHNRSIAMTLQGDTLYVPDTGSLSKAQNILMFNEPPQFENDKFCLDFGNGTIARYTKMEKPDCGLPDSIATKQSRIYGCLFKYSGRANNNLIGFQRLRVSNETRDEKNVWLNPLIMSLNVAGDELAKPDDTNIISVNQELQKIPEEDKDKVFFEPHLERDFNGRVALLSYLGDKIREQHRSMSAVETLLFGTNQKNAVLAFVALDALGGAFEMRRYGSADLKLIWHPPVGGLSPNGKKLAKALLLKWGGTLEKTEKWPVAEPAPQRVPDIYNPLWESVSLVSQADAKKIETSAAKALEIIKDSEQENSDQTTMACLHDIISFDQAIFDRCHIGHYRLRKFDNDQWDFSFDIMGFYQDFAERFLVPRSPVLIDLPSLDDDALDRLPRDVLKAHENYEKKRKVDIVKSLDYGTRTMLVQILRHILDPVPADKRVDLPYHFGWSWQWYQLLYSHPFDMQLHFQLPLQSSAVLGHAKIGMAILGKKLGPTLYKATTPIRM